MTLIRRRRAARALAGASCAVALLVSSVALSGCDAESRPAPSATALPEGISATLLPSATPDQALVRITNNTDESLSIGSLQIDDPRFEWAGWARSIHSRTVPQNTTSLVSVTLPDARCAATKGDGTRVTLEYGLGASIAVASATIPDPAGVVTTHLSAQCGG